MSYNVNNIIQINTRIVPQGLGFANFAEAMLFAPESELPVGFEPDEIREYTDMTALSVDFSSGTETYQAANRWLGGVPATRSLRVYGVNDLDAAWSDTLDKARNVTWWFWSFFTKEVYADTAVAEEIAGWCNTAESWFQNCQTNLEAIEIRKPAVSDDIASTLTTAGYRFAGTLAHLTDPYAGIALCKWFAAVNYSAIRSTITGEFKKLTGVASESLTDTEYGAMTKATKKCQFYTTVDLQGSSDVGRVINSWSHSSYGEYMDDVINLAAFVNALKVSLYNTLANSPTKIGQDPVGQAMLIGAARSICEQYVANDYLGPRNYTDPDDGIDKFTVGYEILTKPEDILDLSDEDRDSRLSAPMRIRVFRKGAIHKSIVDIDVY